MIASIERYVTRTYNDTGQVSAVCDWIDTTGKGGRTEGMATNAHMLALRARAEREGLTLQTETWEPVPPAAPHQCVCPGVGWRVGGKGG